MFQVLLFNNLTFYFFVTFYFPLIQKQISNKAFSSMPFTPGISYLCYKHLFFTYTDTYEIS